MLELLDRISVSFVSHLKPVIVSFDECGVLNCGFEMESAASSVVFKVGVHRTPSPRQAPLGSPNVKHGTQQEGRSSSRSTVPLALAPPRPGGIRDFLWHPGDVRLGANLRASRRLLYESGGPVPPRGVF